MPDSTPASKADLALAVSASGQFLQSTGPGTIPTTKSLVQSDVSGLPAALTSKADDAAVVKLVGDQSIAGGKTFADTTTHQKVMDLRGASGTYMFRVYDPNATGFPFDLETYMGAAGNIATGRWMDIGQGRIDNGDVCQIAANNYFNVANVEPHMFQVWPDVNGPGIKIQSASSTPSAGNENAPCIAFYNADDPDPNFYPSAFAAQTGKKQLQISGDGRHDWGPNLAKTPLTNRTASLYRDPSNNYLTLTSSAGIQLPGVKFTEGAAAGDGVHPILTMGDVSPSVAAIFERKSPSQNFYFGESTDAGSTFFRGLGGLVATASNAGSSTYAAVQNGAGNGTGNEARLYLAPHSGFTFPDTSPYVSSYNVGNNAGFRFATYNSGMSVMLQIAPDGTLTHTGAGLGFFGGAAHAQFTGGAATAGGTYGATEQLMLQTLWNMARGYHFLT